MLVVLLIMFMLGSTFYTAAKLLSIIIHKAAQTEQVEPLTPTAAQTHAVPVEAAPPVPVTQESPPSSVEDAEAVQRRSQALGDSLRVSGLGLGDRELARTLEQLAVTLELLAHNAQIDPRDIPATLRFLDRYGEPLDRLVNAYAGMERAHGATPAMRKSMKQIKAMLLDFSRAYEKFRLSLFENDIMSAAVEMDVARSLLAQDGLGGSAFAVTELTESGGV